MSDGLAAVQARVAELQSLLGMSTPAQVTSAGGSSGFASALATALADGTLGGTGSAGSGSSGTATAGSGTAAALAQLTSLSGSALTGSDLTGSGLSGLSGLAGLGALSGASGTGQTTGTLGERAVALAATYNGVPYKWGGTDPSSGLDCSGLVQLVYGKLGATLPRVASDQSHVGTAVASVDAAQPGDLVFFGKPAHHVGIYVGDGKMIDAPHTGSFVGIHKLWGTPSSIRRVSPDTAAASVASVASVASATSGTSATTVSAAGSTGGQSAVAGPYADLFTQAGRRYGVDPTLLSAIAKAESGYNPGAVSPVGAQGLMQLMPATAKGLGVDAHDPAQAVDGAARMVRDLLRRFDGRVDLAVAAYNAGPGAVQRYGGIPPYRETQTYVQRVLGYQKELR